MFQIDRSREQARRNDSKAGYSHEVKIQAENVDGAVHVLLSRDLN